MKVLQFSLLGLAARCFGTGLRPKRHRRPGDAGSGGGMDGSGEGGGGEGGTDGGGGLGGWGGAGDCPLQMSTPARHRSVLGRRSKFVSTALSGVVQSSMRRLSPMAPFIFLSPSVLWAGTAGPIAG